jgi:hypothetical protein
MASNRTGDHAEWDMPALGRLLDELRLEEPLEGTGYDEAAAA